MLRTWLIALMALTLWGCGESPTTAAKSRILLMGDSLMASNRGTGKAVADQIEAHLGEEVVDRSVAGARYFYTLPISGAAGMRLPAQYLSGNWEWVVMSGYGNDILFGCGCGKCDDEMNRLISADGSSGAIVDEVRFIRNSGARVVYTGYLRTPGFASPVERCGPIGTELDRRIALFAATDPGITFVSLADIVPSGDHSYHSADRIHPSPKGSAAIGAKVDAVIEGQ